MSFKLCCLLLMMPGLLPAAAPPDSPFEFRAELRPSDVYPALAVLRVGIPPEHMLYADELRVAVDPGVELKPVVVPAPVEIPDPFAGHITAVYTSDFTAVYALTELPDARLVMRVDYLGCDATVCFLPQTAELLLREAGQTAAEPAAGGDPEIGAPDADWAAMLEHFEVRGARAGYMRPPEFIAFIDATHAGDEAAAAETAHVPAGGAWWWLLAGVLLGGLALNLTPCVLPMIPVNLAIIGAGTQGGERGHARRRGLRLGTVYGLGIAAAYGSLSLPVMLTGGTFGAVNATPWFNFSVAVLFLAMALAMFDLLVFDLSRWQARLAVSRGGLLAVFGMGALSALLAGACVAPVVVTVLTYALTWYAAGHRLLGLMLPFMLGVGMALPWPAAGAGLAVLPRPGPWMVWVKRLFGVLILAMALYYARQGWLLARPAPVPDADAVAHQDETAGDWMTSLPAALERARETGRPLLIDFWATWCKTCLAMDASTLRHPDVLERMREFVLLKYQAEHPGRSPAREVLQAFNVLGLPTFVVLAPRPEVD